MTLRLTLTALILFYGAVFSQAHAGDRWWDTPRDWVGHHWLAVKSWVQQLDDDQKLEAHRYLNYEQREQCQNYRQPPQGMTVHNCDLHLGSAPENADLGKVFRSYTLYFGFDSASLTSESRQTINKISREISAFAPEQVTVSGHADRSGPSQYNVGLSKRRAENVSSALSAKGVENRVMRKAAFGEDKLAVSTNDGVREAKNRRVVIEFRR